MDQAATQPARASSAAPAQTTTVAHTAPPAPGFWEKTLEPAVFWTAASAAAMVLAVVAAFLVPVFTEHRQQARRRRYAVEMLQTVLHEATRFVALAEQCVDITDLMVEHTGQKDIKKPPASPHAYAVEWDAAALQFLPSKEGLSLLQILANETFPEFTANKLWLLDLDPSEAGVIQQAYSEVIALLLSMKGMVSRWPAPYELHVNHIAIFGGMAARAAYRLGEAVGVLAKSIGSQTGNPPRG